MGLDITAYNRLRYVEPQPEQDEDGDFVYLANCNGFDRLSPQVAGYYLSEGEAVHVYGSPYSAYSRWREHLARLAGWPPAPFERYGREEMLCAASAWAATEGPFWELINFSDNDGSIGQVVSAKLEQDFVAYRESIALRARLLQDEGRFMQQYDRFTFAFGLAADGGAVDFH